MTQFEALGLSPGILKSVEALGFSEPTPIQREAIPLVIAGHDLMGLAQTGTGKTAAFGLPLVHHLLAEKARPAPKSIRSLILAPTRELANQIAGNLRDYVRRTPLRINVVVGGASINAQIRDLKRGTDILVATPGRLLDLVDRKAVFLDTAKFLVLDEADQMLDLGFIHSLKTIAKLLGTPRQTLLFSATMPKSVETLSRAYLTDPVRIETSPSGRAADKVSQSVHFMPQKGKTDLLRDLLAQRPNDLSLVFSRTKHGAEKLMKTLAGWGFKTDSIHGNKSQGQRDRAIKAFRSGQIRVLVATDVAARGIDIPGVSHVYNFDLPEVAENYVHRIGRTARAGAEGEAVAFCSADEFHLLRGVEKLMGIKVRVASGSLTEEEKAMSSRNAKARGRRGARPNNGARGKPQWRGRKGENSGGKSADQGAAGPAGKNRHTRNGDAAEVQEKIRAAANAGNDGAKRKKYKPGRKRSKPGAPANENHPNNNSGKRPAKRYKPKRKFAAA